MSRPRPMARSHAAALAKALAGEDRMIAERLDPGPPPFVRPARRWVVPAGCIVPCGAVEYAACRALASRGLMDSWHEGQGGYRLTPSGRSEAERVARLTGG